MVTVDVPARVAIVAQPPSVQASPAVKALQDKALAADRREARRLLDEALALARTSKDRVGEGRVLLQLSAAYGEAGQLEKAIELCQQATEIARAVGDGICEGNAFNNLGMASGMLGRHDAALEAFTRCAEVRQRRGDRVGEGDARLSLGAELIALNRRPEAYTAFLRALALAQASGNTETEASALTNLGNLEGQRGQFDAALERFRKALPLHRKVGNAFYAANTLLAMGQTLVQLGRPDKAMAAFEEALPIYRGQNDSARELECLIALANVCMSRIDWVKALEYLPTAAIVANALGDRAREAEIRNQLGVAYFHTDAIWKAAENWRKAEALFQALDNLEGVSGALTNQGNIFQHVSQLEKALELYERGLAGHRKTGNRSFEATTLMMMGNAYLKLGKTQRAIELYQKALPLYRAIPDRHGEGMVLANLANLYEQSGQSQPALGLYRQAQALFHATKDVGAEAGVLTNTGKVYAALGRPRESLALYQRALPLHRAVRNLTGESATLSGIGLSLRTLGRPQEALASYEQARAAARRADNGDMEAAAQAEMARAYLALRLPRRALPLCRLAISWYQATQSRDGEAAVLQTLADAEEALGQTQEATAHLLRTVALLESLRADLGGYTEAKASFLMSHRNAYYACLRMLLAQGRTAEAFAVAQKTKARSLLDLMAAGRVDLSAALTPEERAQEAALRDQADALNAEMVRQGVENQIGAKSRYEALKVRLRAVEAKLQALTDTLYARHPDLAQKRVTRTLDAASVARSLPEDTALLEYAVLGKDDIRLFMVTRAGVAVRRLSARYTALRRDAARLRAACADPRQEYRRAARALYATLVRPAEGALQGKRRVVVCPDGALWDVPFQALVGGDGRFLAERCEIAYAYSATGVQAALSSRAGRKGSSGTLLAVANPDFGGASRFGDTPDVPGQRPIDAPSRPIDAPSRPIDSPSRAIDAVSRGRSITPLPGTQREADALRRLFPDATVLTGAAAQEAAIKARAGEFRYLHLATHGFVNDGAPLLSSVVLAQPEKGGKDDGFLTARELYGLRLSAEMTVLSACNTARGEVRTGDGVIGLTWALFVAGCPTQVVSQWAVDDASTATLMTRFYGNLASKKLGKGAALRQASLSLLDDPKRRHPYYWAPFVLMGDWR